MSVSGWTIDVEAGAAPPQPLAMTVNMAKGANLAPVLNTHVASEVVHKVLWGTKLVWVGTPLTGP